MVAVAAFDWTLCPEFEHLVTKRLRASSTDSSRGYVLSKRVWDTELRTFQLNWKNADKGKQYELLRYWRLARTNLRFTYTPQDGSGVIDAKLLRRPLMTQTAHGRWQMSALITEQK